MTRPRAAIAALLALIALPGCRAMGIGALDRPGIGGNPVMDETTKEIVDSLNENARQINSLQAKTSITASMPGRVGKVTAYGMLLMQRPRDFKLVLRGSRVMSGEVASIGSNLDGFWFYVRNPDDPAVYTCKYDADGKVPAGIPLTMQPDWIVEALGLREIDEDEARSLKISRGEIPGTYILRGKRPTGDDRFYVTEMVVNAETRRIISHTILAPDRKTVLTKAELSDYAKFPADGDSASPEPVLPGRIILTWVGEGVKLDVTLNPKELKLNATFPEQQFAELRMPNVPRRDLATVAGPNAGISSTHGATTVRESRPSPALGRRPRVFLRDPVPISNEGAPPQPGDAKPLDADLPILPGAPSEASASLVTPPLPGAPSGPDSGVSIREARRPAWYGIER